MSTANQKRKASPVADLVAAGGPDTHMERMVARAIANMANAYDLVYGDWSGIRDRQRQGRAYFKDGKVSKDKCSVSLKVYTVEGGKPYYVLVGTRAGDGAIAQGLVQPPDNRGRLSGIPSNLTQVNFPERSTVFDVPEASDEKPPPEPTLKSPASLFKGEAVSCTCYDFRYKGFARDDSVSWDARFGCKHMVAVDLFRRQKAVNALALASKRQKMELSATGAVHAAAATKATAGAAQSLDGGYETSNSVPCDQKGISTIGARLMCEHFESQRFTATIPAKLLRVPTKAIPKEAKTLPTVSSSSNIVKLKSEDVGGKPVKVRLDHNLPKGDASQTNSRENVLLVYQKAEGEPLNIMNPADDAYNLQIFDEHCTFETNHSSSWMTVALNVASLLVLKTSLASAMNLAVGEKLLEAGIEKLAGESIELLVNATGGFADQVESGSVGNAVSIVMSTVALNTLKQLWFPEDSTKDGAVPEGEHVAYAKCLIVDNRQAAATNAGQKPRAVLGAMSSDFVTEVEGATDAANFKDVLQKHWNKKTNNKALVAFDLGSTQKYDLEYTCPSSEVDASIVSMAGLRAFLQEVKRWDAPPLLKIVDSTA